MSRVLTDDARQVAARWRGLSWPAAAGGDLRESVLAGLLAAYGAPERHYHGLAHLRALLDLSARYARHLGCPGLVDLAIFFHDAVYDPACRGNEEASAALARVQLGRLGFGPAFVSEVARFIAATKHEPVGAGNAKGDLAWFLDFDLAILAAAPDSYAAYAAAIRREYAAVPENLYRQGRRRVLESFLARPVLFATPSLRASWELRARRNLAWELAFLETG